MKKRKFPFNVVIVAEASFFAKLTERRRREREDQQEYQLENQEKKKKLQNIAISGCY